MMFCYLNATYTLCLFLIVSESKLLPVINHIMTSNKETYRHYVNEVNNYVVNIIHVTIITIIIHICSIHTQSIYLFTWELRCFVNVSFTFL